MMTTTSGHYEGAGQQDQAGAVEAAPVRVAALDDEPPLVPSDPGVEVAECPFESVVAQHWAVR